MPESISKNSLLRDSDRKGQHEKLGGVDATIDTARKGAEPRLYDETSSQLFTASKSARICSEGEGPKKLNRKTQAKPTRKTGMIS